MSSEEVFPSERIFRRLLKVGTVWAAIATAAGSTSGARNNWAEGTPGKSNGATREYYNRAGLLPWKNFLGDWRDARNTPQGEQ